MQVNPDYLYSVDVNKDISVPVVGEVEEILQIIRPYTSSDVRIATYFYDREDTVEEQQQSLIYFENTYMKNTGVLYQAQNTFDCVAVLSGTVLNIKEDDILGNVVEVEHNPNLRTIYYSLGEVNVQVGEALSQGDLIGTSGENNITDSASNLLFEVYYNGTLIDPEEFYNMDVTTLEQYLYLEVIALKELIIYFCDNTLYIVHNMKIIEKKMDSIYQGLVVDRTKFIESFMQILKKEKIKTKLFGDKIYIVKDVYFNERDMFYLENIFLELGFVQVLFMDIKDLFLSDYTYIGIFKDYMVFYLDKPVFLDLYYFKDFPKLISYFQEYYESYVVLFGTNENIPEINQSLINIYYIDNYKDFIVKSLLKVKKYGV